MHKWTTLLPIAFKNFWVDEAQGIIYLDCTFEQPFGDIAKGEYFDRIYLSYDGELKFMRHSGKCYEGYAQELIVPQMEEAEIQKDS